MNLAQKLSSKNVLVFNLVLVGIIFGFSLAFVSFSCAAPSPRVVVRAQEPPQIVIPENAFEAAYGLQLTFNAIADKVLPSVVELQTFSITQRNIPNLQGIPWDFFFGPRERGPEGGGGQRREFRSQGLGSGIIVRNYNGIYYVLTNDHVVADTTEIRIATKNGTEYPAEIVGRDPRRDLAMVSFRSNNLYPLAALGDSDSVRVGDWAIAMGNPLGQQFSFSVTMGIVSAVGRTGGPGGNINDFIQTDAPINQGNSGGALVNIRGEVIGINTWIASTTGGGNVGLGFAIPINNAKRSIDEFIATGTVTSGWLGVSLLEPSREMAEAIGVHNRNGALVTQVFIGSPAGKGGISPGDFITHVNGREVRGVNQLTMMVGDLRPGDNATFALVRDRGNMEVRVVIEERTVAVASDNRNLWPGIIVAPRQAGADDARGLQVAQIIQGSPADIIGLRGGDLITSVNGEDVNDLPSFFRELRERTANELRFGFTRGGSQLESLTFRR
ncbi:MAG: trypsin-like peptidase domain-containing protein [Treponema sp.]|nr:trypsin-like peptidase domain-containing protein [Treponema sp.]